MTKRRLLLNRVNHLRVRMANQHRTRTDQIIHLLGTMNVPDTAALTACDYDVRIEIAKAAGG